MASCYADLEATQKRANLLATEDLYETGQHRLHSIDLSLLARYDLTAKFLDFRILDGRPLTHENSRCMMRDHRRQEALVANGGLLPNPQEKGTESDNADYNWSCHQSGHVELIEIAIDIRESVHHGIHEYVHRDERECGHYGKMHVMTIAAHV